MRYSQLYTKTTKNVPADADSANARYLEQGGFIHREMAGVYSYLPLGLRVLRKIDNIIREEMNAIGGQEILMPALSPKENWMKTGRWDGLDVLFKLPAAGGKEYALGATHEEVVTPLVQDHVFSYKDLPMSVYQIQTKFRNELRAKSGILRGREFGMKDLYSFDKTEEELDEFYEKAKVAYTNVFKRVGFKPEDTYLTFASGGTFSKYSHEYQIAAGVGEDLIYTCDKCVVAVNKEIIEDQDSCPECGNKNLTEKNGIEVGNIFKLKTKYSEPFGFKFTDEDGTTKPVIMGCYGIGNTRLMGSLVEVFHDERGIIWPKNVSPYFVHLIVVKGDENAEKEAEKLYKDLEKEGIEVFFDDRDERPGAKFADADLMGMPLRLVVSKRTLESDSVEWKLRPEAEGENVPLKDVVKKVKALYKED